MVEAGDQRSESVSSSSETSDSYVFEADVARLLHLMVHSVYSERDIFLRELISNAADACEKLRYEALTQPHLLSASSSFAITLTCDKKTGTLWVEDNGIGMSRQDLVESLGTIARSGTRAFLERLGPQKTSEQDLEEDQEKEGGPGGSSTSLIGQFGIGFYASFMVADRVDVFTRRAGEQEAWIWSSQGEGSYTLHAAPPETAPLCGTKIQLHLKASEQNYLEPATLERLVREHSSAIPIRILLKETPESEPRSLTEGVALWAKPKSDITEDAYTEFYRSLSGQWDTPALTLHWHAEGRHDYTVLAFIPSTRPLDLFDPARKGRAKLYVRRVLITEDADILPPWLRFVRFVVDSSDLSLNVSREMLQKGPVVTAMSKAITNKILQELAKFSFQDPSTWNNLWDQFGSVLKEGLYEDPSRRDALLKLARFATSEHPQGHRSLEDYIASLRPNQTSIYILTGDDKERLALHPQLEIFRARQIEVLLLSDPVDAFWSATSLGYEGKPFVSITQGTLDLSAIPFPEGASAPSLQDVSPEVATFLAFMKQTLESATSDVRASSRLASSLACLVAPEGGLDRRLERLLSDQGQRPLSQPILEINPHHPLIEQLAAQFKNKGASEDLKDRIWLIHDEIRLSEGEKLLDPAAFSTRLLRVLGHLPA